MALDIDKSLQPTSPLPLLYMPQPSSHFSKQQCPLPPPLYETILCALLYIPQHFSPSLHDSAHCTFPTHHIHLPISPNTNVLCHLPYTKLSSAPFCTFHNTLLLPYTTLPTAPFLHATGICSLPYTTLSSASFFTLHSLLPTSPHANILCLFSARLNTLPLPTTSQLTAPFPTHHCLLPL